MQREREKGVQLGWRAGGKIRIPGEPWHHAAPVGVEGSLKRAYEDPRTLLRDVPSRCARSTACFVAHRAVRRSFSRPRGGCRER